jgi:hypothetical protein
MQWAMDCRRLIRCWAIDRFLTTITKQWTKVMLLAAVYDAELNVRQMYDMKQQQPAD